jgi:hypothetical protein
VLRRVFDVYVSGFYLFTEIEAVIVGVDQLMLRSVSIFVASVLLNNNDGFVSW